jgi:hypothetical protein
LYHRWVHQLCLRKSRNHVRTRMLKLRLSLMMFMGPETSVTTSRISMNNSIMNRGT